MKRLFAALAVLLLAPAFALAAVAQAGDAGTPHNPDLQTLKPSDIHLQRDRATGQKLLRFSNTIANLGQGPLELRPVNNAANGTTDAYQRVYTHDAGGDWSPYSETQVGTFAFHPAHNHWHFGSFATYELRNVAPDGGIGSTVYAISDKVSFCVIDITSVDPSLEHASGSTYLGCSQNGVQGLSVGWADVYTWSLAGQSLDVTNIANGTYWLVSTADPENLVAETNDGNNAGAVKVQLKGNTAKVVR
jgi:hypothetical protein